MIQRSKLDEFYTSLDSINIHNTNLDQKRDELKNIIDTFDNHINTKSVSKELIAQNKQLGGLLESSLLRLKEQSSRWVENFSILLEREKFRSDLENYFIVIIFGKVKAGKSSLGNFIAKNNTSNNKATFFKYDEAGNEEEIKKLEEIDDDNGFATNNLECTIEIQGFKLSGLAWIDTPGLGSMVEANGELAKKYIQSADYIIYPTSSDAPMQQDEIAQIQELFEQKKQVTICITKSDTKEKRKDSNGKYIKDSKGKIANFLVNKSNNARNSQEQSARNDIKKLNGGDDSQLGKIFSISAHTAQKGLDKEDSLLFDQSNISKFYELITEVIKQKASTIKSKTPYNGIIAFIDNELNKSIYALEGYMNSFNAQIKEANDRFDIIKKNTDAEIESEIDFIISKEIHSINKDNIREKFREIDAVLSKNISSIVNNNIKEILQGFNASLSSLDSTLNSSDEFEIKDEYRDIEVWYEDRSFLNIVTFGLLGESSDSMTERVIVGNNKEEMIFKFKKDRISGYIEVAKENYHMVQKSLFIPLRELSDEIGSEVDKLKLHIDDYKTRLRSSK